MPPSQSEIEDSRINLRGVVADSVRLLMMEHSTRIIVQAKTRRELGGPFWNDYRRSVRIPDHWSDGDGWLVNYVAIRATALQRSRLRTSAWIAAYSLQFELGPLSEASIGNVGKNPRTTGWIDYVITPVGGLGVMVAEDALDRYVIARLERRIQIIYRVIRVVLNPSRALANAAGARPPWYPPSYDRSLGVTSAR